VLLITNDNPACLPDVGLPAFPLRSIDGGGFLARCGIAPREAMVLVLDRNQRIALLAPSPEPACVAEACLACLRALPREAARDVTIPAPAIILPNLLSPAQCAELIDLFESSPTLEGAVARADSQGRLCNVVDPDKKRRRDLVIEPGTALHAALLAVLLARCGPEIAKAFHARIAHADRILVARYDDSGGWFRRHRDNESASVAFREFALSVNLNTGDYDGGHLSFPEYNDHRYRPAAGAGVIFSTSLLHEAAPVTRGSRYVLLTFFHGDAAERRRRRHAQVEPVPAGS
jgi:predicted 2-oxoglutarate/Fe(II)-dependent dioxygenase YbiX